MVGENCGDQPVGHVLNDFGAFVAKQALREISGDLADGVIFAMLVKIVTTHGAQMAEGGPDLLPFVGEAIWWWPEWKEDSQWA